jgi:hypothetical protein
MWVLYVRNSTLICQENAGCVMFHIAKDAVKNQISFRVALSAKSIVAMDVENRLICAGDAVILLVRSVLSWRRTRISCLESVRVRFHGFPSCVDLFVENCSQELLRYLPPNNHMSTASNFPKLLGPTSRQSFQKHEFIKENLSYEIILRSYTTSNVPQHEICCCFCAQFFLISFQYLPSEFPMSRSRV